MERALFVVLLASALSFSAYAEPNSCVAGLIPNVTMSMSSRQLDMAVLKLVDENAFNELQKGGSGALKIPIKGVPVEAGGSYQEWDRRRRQYLEVNKFDLSYDESFLLVRRVVPEIAYSAYKECLMSASNVPGVHIIVDDYTDKEAFVTVRWTPPPNESGSMGPTTVSVEASGTTAEMSKLPDITLGAGHSRLLTFPLTPGSILVITASTKSGFSQRRVLDVSSRKLAIPDTQQARQVTVKDLLIKALDEGKVCVVRLGEHDWSNRPEAYLGAPASTSSIDNLFEVRYESDSETWRSHGRYRDASPMLGVYRGPSLAKQQINIYNVLYALGEDGVLTALGPGVGRDAFKVGRLFCPISTGDVR